MKLRTNTRTLQRLERSSLYTQTLTHTFKHYKAHIFHSTRTIQFYAKYVQNGIYIAYTYTSLPNILYWKYIFIHLYMCICSTYLIAESRLLSASYCFILYIVIYIVYVYWPQNVVGHRLDTVMFVTISVWVQKKRKYVYIYIVYESGKNATKKNMDLRQNTERMVARKLSFFSTENSCKKKKMLWK